jgi:hypothetical protein
MKFVSYLICFPVFLIRLICRLTAGLIRLEMAGKLYKHVDAPAYIRNGMTVSLFRPVARNGVERRLPFLTGGLTHRFLCDLNRLAIN